MKLISPQEFRATLGLTAHTDGPPSLAAVADLLRWTVWRSGTCLQSDATQQVHATLAEAGFSPAHSIHQIDTALDRLLLLGDITVVKVAGMDRLAPVQPRIIPLDDSGLAAIIGTIPSRLLDEVDLQHQHTVTRRCSLTDVSTMSALIEAGAERWPLSAWIGPPESSRLLRRFGVDDHTPLVDAWEDLMAALAKVAEHDSDPSDLEPIGGFKMDFDSSARAPNPIGNTAPIHTSMWIGTRNADTASPPVFVITGDNTAPSQIQLRNLDEARWLILLKTIAQAPARCYSVTESANHVEIRFFVMPPQQAIRMLDLFGDRVDRMRWRLPEELIQPLITNLKDLGIQAATKAIQEDSKPR